MVLHDFDRYKHLQPVFLGGGLLMHPHNTGIDHLNLAVVGRDYRIHQLVPDSGFTPAVEPIVNRRRRTVALRHVGPRGARAQDPENTV